jgi:hypothetical protein
MVLAWFPWWWDATLGLPRVQVVLAAASALLTLGLGVIAWWLAKRQVEIAKRQMDMQKEQHNFFMTEFAKKTDLRIIVPGIGHQVGSHMETTTTIRFNAHNGSDKSADGFYWEILVPQNIAHLTRFVDDDGNELESHISHISATEHYQKRDGHYTHKLFPRSGLEVAQLQITGLPSQLQEFAVKWRIRGEDGMIPPEGLAFIKFKRLPDQSYAWSDWHAGQKEDDIQGFQSG